MARRRFFFAVFMVAAMSGCRPSKRFVLPSPDGAAEANVRFEWREQADPVMARGSGWDAVDTLNPSVIRWRGQHWNLYSGFDGKTWHTGVAVSTDSGLTWTRRQKVLSPEAWEGSYIAANGSALVMPDDALAYWYQAGRETPAIGLARSNDGIAWRKEASPVLEPGPRGSWDERGVADPYVIRRGEYLYLYYTGMDRAQRQRLGVARSSDGVVWQKSLDNPILDIGGHEEWDEGGLGEPAVWSSHGAYWMLYTGRAWDEKRRVGLARSSDGIHWAKLRDQVFAGASPWDAAVICDPSVDASDPAAVRVWFGGGNKPSPDERLNGQIGIATLLKR